MSLTRKNSNRNGVKTPEIMPSDPPPAVIRWMAVLIMLLFVVVLAAAIIVRVPETVKCPFVLMSQSGADPLQSPILGMVDRVNVVEGQEVTEGAVLMVLRSDEVRTWQTQLQSQREDLRVRQQRAARMEELYQSQLAIKQEEIQQAEQEVGFRGKHLATSRDFVVRMTKLAEAKLLSEVELLQAELQLAESEKDLNIAQKTRQQVALELKEIETNRLRQKSDEEGEIAKLQFSIDALTRQLDQCTGDTLTVRAPFTGVVISLTHRNPGGVAQKGQELCQLARTEGNVQARLWLNENGMPRMALGQRVRLFFEAFPYQRYGTITGKLDWLSPASVNSTEGPRFVGRAALDQLEFVRRDHATPLRVGMRGHARVVVGHRTLIEYAFDPIRQLREHTRH